MKTYLVTGGCGFIGSNFIRLLFEKETNVHVVNLDALTYAGNPLNVQDVKEKFPDNYTFIHGDVADQQVVDEIFHNYQINSVVHFAAESHVDRSIQEPLLFIRTNVLGTTVLLNTAMKHWKEQWEKNRFLYISTDEVYGSLPLDQPEKKFDEESPLQPNSPYASSKAAADLLVQSYYTTYGFPAIITRCSNNFGPFQFPEKLIPLMIMNMIEGQPLPIYGKGENIRDWIYVQDHCEALLEVLHHGKTGEIYNIGGSNEISNSELLNVLSEIVAEQTQVNPDEYEKHITFVKDRPGHDLRYALDCSKIQNKFGWNTSFDFSVRLKETVRWYLENENWILSVKTGAYQEWIERQYSNRLEDV
ncbi:MAG TPA: dTDP-glucose 4,6-dehydratase [Candidatus Cloacimonetes bacterium]|nr:dTDP-glucose 4,6-dehydratase [Candidatus Cloacimonadota bacterium]HEX37994.1 dTDP-glucose 4,6-dehydratase [Candidatus Cloacimonadota bacterium]